MYLSAATSRARRHYSGNRNENQNKSQSEDTVTKWVYFFGAGKAEGDGTWRDLLGGKGARLAEMTKIGLPVPAGFTISTEACDYFYKNGKKHPPELKKQVADNVAKLEKVTGKKLGDVQKPLLVSVRSGSARSMPGMMETILNLGLNDRSVEGLAAATKNERFAYEDLKPLLVSVRAGSARSMPGMMETILNLGLNDRSVEGLAAATKNERFAY